MKAWSNYILTFYSIRYINGKISAVFEVELPNRACVYMYVARSDYMDDQRCVVVVDAKKFDPLWRSEPDSAYAQQNMGKAGVWRCDENHKVARDAFACGLDAPVFLPEISCTQLIHKVPVYQKKWLFFKKLVRVDEKRIDYVSIVDGMPAILWLLVHRVKAFPVECDKESADRLTALAGYPDQTCRTVDQLINNN